MILRPRFFHCECGKIHTDHMLTPLTKCKCGRTLLDQVRKIVEAKAQRLSVGE